MIHEPNNSGSDELQPRLEGEGINVREVHGEMLRDKDNARSGYDAVPLWMVSFFMALLFWGGAYLAFYSGGFKSEVFDPSQVAWAGGGAAAEKAAPDPKVVGKRLFTANCVACHQATGLGIAGQFPPLVGSEWVLTEGQHGDNHLISILLHGLQGPIQVKGATYNGAMPPWQQLKDDQIAAILTYIRSEWGNTESAITPEQVAKIRTETATQTEPYTQPKILSVPPVEFEDAPAAGTPPAPGADTPAAPAKTGA